MWAALQLLVFLFALLEGQYMVVIAAATWFAYWHPSWWLFLVAVLVDAYLGQFEAVPILSLGVGAFVLFVEALKIHLLGTQYE